MILRIEQDQKQPPPTDSSSISITSARTRDTVSQQETLCWGPNVCTSFPNRCWQRLTGKSHMLSCMNPSLSIITHHYPLLCGFMSENGNVPPQMANLSWGTWWEKLVDFGAKAMAFHGFPPRPEAESRWGMLQRWAEKLPGFRKKSWASASHGLEIDELAVGWSIFAKPSKKIKKMQMPCCSGQRVVLCFLLQQPLTYLVWSRCVATAHLFVWCHWSCGMFVCGTFESRDA